MDAKMEKQIKIAQKEAAKVMNKAQAQLKQARKNIEARVRRIRKRLSWSHPRLEWH